MTTQSIEALVERARHWATFIDRHRPKSGSEASDVSKLLNALADALSSLTEGRAGGDAREAVCTECGHPLVLHCADCDNLLWDIPNGIVTITQMQDDRVFILRTHRTEGQERLFFGTIEELHVALRPLPDPPSLPQPVEPGGD